MATISKVMAEKVSQALRIVIKMCNVSDFSFSSGTQPVPSLSDFFVLSFYLILDQSTTVATLKKTSK